MSESDPSQAQAALQQAQQALREKRFAEANQWALQAARLDPGSEEAWLILAAFAPPKQALVFIEHVLDQNPNSIKAQQAKVWAQKRLSGQTTPLAGSKPTAERTAPLKVTQRVAVPAPTLEHTAPHKSAEPVQASTAAAALPAAPVILPAPLSPAPAPAPVVPTMPARPKSRRWMKIIGWSAAALLVCAALAALVLVPLTGFVIASYSSAQRPAGALDKPTLPAANQTEIALASTAVVLQATVTSAAASPTLEPSPTELPPTDTALPTETAIPTETSVPTETPLPSQTPVPPGTIPVVVPTFIATLAVQPLPPPQPYQPEVPSQPNAPVAGEDHWIDVNLSQQTASAYEGNNLVRSFVVSTGTSAHPTVTGQFRVYVKYQYADMAGPGYYLPNVPYVMYFYKGYGLHGTYWHSNFGTPMSHGCVNFSIPDAAWLYDFVSIGTLVNVHY